MKTLHKRVLVGFQILFCLISSTTVFAQQRWTPPFGGVIRDKIAAISVARAIWISMNPDLPKSSEEIWEKDMDANLDRGVWHIHQKPLGSNYIGGGLVMKINASDGRVTLIMITQ